MGSAAKVVLAFFYHRVSPNLNMWRPVKGERDDSEPWRGTFAWRNDCEHSDKQAWINVGVELEPGQDLDDVIDVAWAIADAKFHELYPGATLAEPLS